MKRVGYSVLFLIAAFGYTCAQERSLPVQAATGILKPLRILNSVASNQTGESMQLPIRCDGEGNIYLRLFHGRAAIKEPVLKFNNKGEQKGTYSIADDAAFQGLGRGILDFAIGKDGKFYALATTAVDDKPVGYIVPFSNSGQKQPRIQIGDKFRSDRFEVFDSGEFLITGTERETELNQEPHSVYTGVFDRAGKLAKKVVLPEDASYEQAAKRGDIDFFEPGDDRGGNLAIERGMAARASDGNVYLMRWTVPAKVYVLSRTGDLVRSFDVTSPLDGKKPASIHASGDRLAIQFEGNASDTRSVIKVVGLKGEEYGAYDTSGVGVAFACYDAPDQFTFLQGGDRLQITTYVPK